MKGVSSKKMTNVCKYTKEGNSIRENNASVREINRMVGECFNECVLLKSVDLAVAPFIAFDVTEQSPFLATREVTQYFKSRECACC
jgi:hypothetical protein